MLKKLAFTLVSLAPTVALAGGGGAAAPDGVGQSILSAIHCIVHSLAGLL